MNGYQCLRCGKLHSAAKVNGWGINGIGAGLGPQAVCDAMIPVPQFADAKQVCKGALLPHATTTGVGATLTEDPQ